MNKIDITQYGDGELACYFQNDEGLYNTWLEAVYADDFSLVQAIADELFRYTDEQLDDLRTEFDDEVSLTENER